jgi:hypothetical protein
MNNQGSLDAGAAEVHGLRLVLAQIPVPHFALKAEGAVALPSVREALRALEDARRANPTLETLVIDSLDVSRFGRGAVVEIARWIPRNGAGLERVVLVSTSAQLRSSVHALAACARSVRVESVETREDALALLGAPTLSLTG